MSTTEAQVAKGLADQSAHPMSRALAAYLSEISAAPVAEVTEHPGAGITGMWHGKKVALGRASWMACAKDGLALSIGDAVRAIDSTQDLLPGSDHIAHDLAFAGLAPQIISGDNEQKTAALAKTIGFDHWRSAVSPEAKASYIKTLAETNAVCMVGDGINDTAALAHATVSIAPGNALDATRNAADILMLGNAMGDVPRLVQVARKSVALSKQNFGIAILYNCVAVPVAIFGFATPLIAALAMSASSITVLVNAMRVKV